MQLLAAALSHIQNLRLRSVLRQQTTVKTHSPAKKDIPYPAILIWEREGRRGIARKL